LRRSLSFAPLFFLIIVFTVISAYPSPALADDPKKELEIIKKKLKKEVLKVEEALKKEKSVFSELEKIDRAVKTKKSELKYYDKRLFNTSSKIDLLKKEIDLLTSKMENRRGRLKERLKILYKQQYTGSPALILVSAKDYQDLLKKSRYISFIAHYDTRLMEQYSEDIKDFHFKKKKLELLQEELEKNKAIVRRKMKEMWTERVKKDKLLASIRNERSSYEKMVKELKGSSTKLRKMIREMEKKKLKTSLEGKEFRKLKGRLSWPVDGNVIVPFGKYKDPKFNIPVFKNGIEIKSATGDTVKSIHGGRVVYADWFKGYGQLLIMDHGKGYHSLYGHLSEIFLKTGDIIKKGTSLGSIGEPRLLNVPTLYFEIRYKGKPIDPMGWLKRKTKTKKKVVTKKKPKIKRKAKK
jgi:septal ring factor EnvC (AmiA/AmiB activator)